MYYEEKRIGDEMFFRGSPNSAWVPFTPEMYMKIIDDLKKSIESYRQP